MYDDKQEIAVEGIAAFTDTLITWRSTRDGVAAAPAGYLHALYAGAFHGEQAAADWRWLMRYNTFTDLAQMEQIQEFSNRAYLLLAQVDTYWVEKMIERALPSNADYWFKTRLANLYAMRVNTKDYVPWFFHTVEVMVRLTIEHIVVGKWHRHLGFNSQFAEDERQLALFAQLIDLYMEVWDFMADLPETVAA